MAQFTREQLVAMGMSEDQISAVLKTEKEHPEKQLDVVHDEQSGNNVVMMNKQPVAQMKVTSMADLQAYSQGTIVRFPDFGEGQPFVARVRRPSMLVLAKSGKIPNSLLNTANQLFAKGGSGLDEDDTKMLGQTYELMEMIAESALIEPSLADIKKAGMELSDDQMMAIFNYSQNGIKALESFR